MMASQPPFFSNSAEQPAHALDAEATISKTGLDVVSRKDSLSVAFVSFKGGSMMMEVVVVMVVVVTVVFGSGVVEVRQ